MIIMYKNLNKINAICLFSLLTETHEHANTKKIRIKNYYFSFSNGEFFNFDYNGFY